MDFTAMTNEELSAYAQDSRDTAHRSFQSCDTDGFLSQASNRAAAEVAELQVTINKNGGRALFLALFDLEGNVVPAIYAENQHGTYWQILNPERPHGPRLGFFNPSRASKLGAARRADAKKGYYVGYAEFPAHAEFGASGYSFYAKAVRNDEFDFSDAVPVDNGINDCEDAERWSRIQDGRF